MEGRARAPGDSLQELETLRARVIELELQSLRTQVDLNSTGEGLAVCRKQYGELFERCMNPILITSRDGAITGANGAARRILGYTEGELIRLHIKDIFSSGEDLYNIVKTVAGKGKFTMDKQTGLRHGSGRILGCRISSSEISDHWSGGPGFQFIVLDMTGGIAGETGSATGNRVIRGAPGERLRLSDEMYGTLFENSIDAICIVSMDGGILDANFASMRLFGHALRKDFMEMNMKNIYTYPGDWDRFEKEVAALGYVRNFEANMQRKDGIVFEGIISATRMQDDNLRMVGYQCIIRDITMQKMAQRRIVEEEQKRKHLVLNTAHLLQTPLTVMKGNLELVNQGIRDFTPEMNAKLLKRLEEMKRLIVGGLYEKMELMTVKTTDGFTPAMENKEKTQ